MKHTNLEEATRRTLDIHGFTCGFYKHFNYNGTYNGLGVSVEKRNCICRRVFHEVHIFEKHAVNSIGLVKPEIVYDYCHKALLIILAKKRAIKNSNKNWNNFIDKHK